MRIIEDNSNYPRYRRKHSRIILYSVKPLSLHGENAIHMPKYGTVKAKDQIDASQDIRSFNIVGVTRRITKRTKPSHHKFQLNIQIRVPVDEHQPTRVSRGADVGGHHLAATADTTGQTANMTHDISKYSNKLHSTKTYGTASASKVRAGTLN